MKSIKSLNPPLGALLTFENVYPLHCLTIWMLEIIEKPNLTISYWYCLLIWLLCIGLYGTLTHCVKFLKIFCKKCWAVAQLFDQHYKSNRTKQIIFFQKHIDSVDQAHSGTTVAGLISLFSKDTIEAATYRHVFRSNKYVIQLSSDSVRRLEKFLCQSHVVLLNVLTSWFVIEEDKEEEEAVSWTIIVYDLSPKYLTVKKIHVGLCHLQFLRQWCKTTTIIYQYYVMHQLRNVFFDTILL